MIREARRDDIDRIFEVLRAAFAQYDGVLDPPSSVFSLDRQAIAAKIERGIVLILEIDGETIGCVFGTIEADGIYVGRLAVRPDSRVAGAGSELLAAIETRARELGFGRCRLEVRIALEDLVNFYRRRGYAVTSSHAHRGYDAPTYYEMVKEF